MALMMESPEVARGRPPKLSSNQGLGLSITVSDTDKQRQRRPQNVDLSWAYVLAVVVSVVTAGFLWELVQFGDPTVHARPIAAGIEFFKASVQVLPLLLLTLAVGERALFGNGAVQTRGQLLAFLIVFLAATSEALGLIVIALRTPPLALRQLATVLTATALTGALTLLILSAAILSGALQTFLALSKEANYPALDHDTHGTLRVVWRAVRVVWSPGTVWVSCWLWIAAVGAAFSRGEAWWYVLLFVPALVVLLLPSMRHQKLWDRLIRWLREPPRAGLVGGDEMVIPASVPEHLHQLVEAMTDQEAARALRLLAPQSKDDDPMARYLAAAPLDDEPLTDEDADAARQAREDAVTGRLTPLDALARELG